MNNFKYSIILNFIIFIFIFDWQIHRLVASTQNEAKNSPTSSSVSAVLETRVINGQPATIGQFPYQVIVYSKNIVCGGAILDKDTVITAAQCIFYPNKDNVLIPKNEIKIGTGDVNVHEANMKNYTVKSVHPHEMYNPKNFYNNLAIIKIHEGFWDESSPTKNIQPIEITSTQYKSGTNCVLAGWGQSNNNEEFTPKILLYKNFTIFNHMKCKSYFWRAKLHITSQMICAISKYSHTCMGDGGSGLVCTDKLNDNSYLVGITSIMQESCQENTPSVFTNIFDYKDWIDNMLSHASEETTTSDETTTAETATTNFSMGLFPFQYYYIFCLVTYFMNN